MGRLTDMTGQRFGKLTAICRDEGRHGKQAAWLCRCDCGNIKSVRGDKLRSGITQSCGCAASTTVIIGEVKHGLSHSRLYHVWTGMKKRCHQEKSKQYVNYGGRGITVCDEWRNSLEAFRDWALANGYDENAPFGVCTIDRIDNDKGYSPDNCRWISHREQQQNKRNSREVIILSPEELELIRIIRQSDDPIQAVITAIEICADWLKGSATHDPC